MKSKKILVFALILTMIATLILSSCGNSSSSEDTPATDSDSSGGNSDLAAQIIASAQDYMKLAQSEMKDGATSSKDTLVFAAVTDPGRIDLGSLLEFTQYPFATMCVEYFMRYDFEKAEFYSPVCDSYETDEDNMGVTFHLTPNIKMNDGNILEPSDVVASIEAFRTHNGLGWQLDFVDLDQTTITDSTTFNLRFKEVNGVWESGFQMLTLVSGKAYEAVNGDVSFFQAPIGPQAYDVTDWVSGDHITVTRFDDYYRGTPPIKTVTMEIISDRTAAFMALQNGDIDLLWNISADQVQTVYAEDNLEQVVMGENMSIWLGMNSANEALSDFRVRKAIFLAIDRQEIIDGAYDGLAYPANSVLTREALGYNTSYDTDPIFPDQNIEEAQALLDDAGYGDGLTLRILAESTINFQLVTELLSAQLEQIGITLDAELTDYATMNAKMFGEDATAYDMTLFLCQDSDDAISTLDNPMLFGATHPELSEAGDGWYALWDEIRATPDTDERIKLYEDVQTYFAEEGLFWVPLAVGQTYVAFDKDLTGFRRNGFMLYFEGAYFR
ncbi:MAG: ABC transporter substrate-binding protein [Clostridiales Family XIII bacterium]|nr:ABC transporter substrate-binding protein [Clostridiales Family XIII bacterium]